MSPNRDFDDIARAWLDLMPDHAPDHAIAAVRKAVETTPQRRAWPWPIGRVQPANRLVAIAAAAIVLVVGTSFLLHGPNAIDPGTVASPTPASSGAALDPIPGPLLARWMGPTNDLLPTGAGSSILIGPHSLAVSQSNLLDRPFLSATADTSGAGQFRLTAMDTAGGCASGGVGTYRWTLSGSGRTLTIAPIADACFARQAVVAGTYWLEGCKDTATACLGDLDAGIYKSQYISPLAAPGATWAPLFGGITYAVPGGWANFTDYPGVFGLAPSSAFAATTPEARTPGVRIDVFRQVSPESQASPCSGLPQDGVEATPDAFLVWLRGLPSVTVGKSSSITINGRSGAWADVAMVPARAPTCGTDQVAEYMVAGGQGEGILAGETQRLIILDAGPGRLLAIRLGVSGGTSLADFATAAMPIVTSMEFR